MDTVKSLLDKAQQSGLTRYAIEKRTGIPQSTLSDIEHGRHKGSPAIAARLATLVDADPAQAALAAVAEQERSDAKRQELSRLFKIAPAAAALALMVLLGATSPTAEAAAIDAHASSTGDRLYIMSTRLRRFLIRIFAAIHDTLHPHHLRHAALTA